MTDTFRQEYRPLTDEIKDDIKMIEMKAQGLLDEFEMINIRTETDKQYLSLAKTNLEQAIMWAVKAIT